MLNAIYCTIWHYNPHLCLMTLIFNFYDSSETMQWLIGHPCRSFSQWFVVPRHTYTHRIQCMTIDTVDDNRQWRPEKKRRQRFRGNQTCCQQDIVADDPSGWRLWLVHTWERVRGGKMVSGNCHNLLTPHKNSLSDCCKPNGVINIIPVHVATPSFSKRQNYMPL